MVLISYLSALVSTKLSLVSSPKELAEGGVELVGVEDVC